MPKLMIVDDELDVREFAANFFRKRRVEVVTVGSGEEALATFRDVNPDLILLDIKMNGISGIETLEGIRKTDSAVKVMMVTGTKPDMNETYKRCMDLGACGYVHKPLELQELERVVMGVLLGQPAPGTPQPHGA